MGQSGTSANRNNELVLVGSIKFMQFVDQELLPLFMNSTIAASTLLSITMK